MIEIKKNIKKALTVPFIFFDLLFSGYSYFLSFFRENLKNLWLEYQKQNVSGRTQSVVHKYNNELVQLKFYTPNAICRMRVDSFSTKEPETLQWIDDYKGQGVLFDIGANVGLYSIYFAKTKNLNVYAFEPSAFNLSLLAKNCFLNNVHEKIKIIPNPLSNINGFANFNLSTIDEGGALSAFGVDFGWDGNEISKSCSYQIAGFSLDYLIQNKIIKDFPSLVKIDVDGIEHLILRGAKNTLSDDRCSSVLVEINDNFTQQSTEASEILKSCGFNLQEKQQSPDLRDSDQFKGLHNQIWIK